MADDDMADQYMDDDEDFDWMYVEDTALLSEELAEMVVPDPGFFSTNPELDMSLYDYDFFDYWDDLEYGDDPYWESAGNAIIGEKRKRNEGAKGTPGKRRKITLKETSGGTTVFISMDERRRLWSRRALVKEDLQSFALLPDWRKRCASADAAMSVKAMPMEMKQAAEANDEETPEGQRHYDAGAAAEEGEGDWEDEVEDELDGPESAGLRSLNIDTEALKTVLRQKLGAAGLDNMSEEAFMTAITSMLQGGGDADDVTGGLADALLNSKSQDSGVSGWLSQQGVPLEEVDEDDDAASVATVEMPESSIRSTRTGMQISPTDSAVHVAKSGRTVQMALHDGSPKAGKRRLAPIGSDEAGGSDQKRKKVAFDVPDSQENADAVVELPQNGEVANAKTAVADDAAIDDEAAEDEPAPEAQPTRATMRAAKTSATTAKSATSKPAPASKAKAGKATAEPVAESAGPAKATRKRKAQTDEDEPPPPPAKKATRKAAAEMKAGKEEAQPSYARATRATRARSGK